MRVVCTVEARMGSTRLPGKVMKTLFGEYTTLECMVNRLRRCEYPDEVVVATSTKEANDVIEEAASNLGVACFRGSEEDVLQRIANCANEFNADVICETTADCPLIDPSVVDQTVACFLDNGRTDYVSNVLTRSWPHGMDVEVFSRDALERADRETTDGYYREHVTTYLRDNPDEFDTMHLSPPPEHRNPGIRVTLDYPEDLELIKKVYEMLSHKGEPFETGVGDLVELFDENPGLREINKEHSDFSHNSPKET